jgi:DNA-binding CsgD family transcriptional regulator
VASIDQLWPDPDRRDEALTRALIRVHSHPDPREQLTEREAQVLTALAHGMDSHEAGTLLGIRPETVRALTGNARRALRAKTTPHAVAEALRQGLIR